ncbi:hypothetical protein [Cellulophaga baltica]|uniref:hypothetical protein n=1 Tax=Cellulophaga baltica TaxID=76594 RepID=UPI00041558FF|nr:hypothetical protein [Cellulophaga baltica]
MKKIALINLVLVTFLSCRDTTAEKTNKEIESNTTPVAVPTEKAPNKEVEKRIFLGRNPRINR